MARDMKQYLRRPDMLFRRVRDVHGQLQLSKAARAFHPGQGVYRSSYKNALRMAATETNGAYRTADHERWNSLDFVTGQEVRLSTNHTLNGIPFTDMCDDLKGKYPKTFKFTGWHPQCRCHVIPVLKTPEEMAADNKRIMNGEEPLTGSENSVNNTPDNFNAWITKNSDRIAAAEKRGSLPYFMEDNKGYWQQTYTVSRKGASAKEDAYQRVNSAETIISKLKELDNDIILRKLEILKNAGNKMGETDGMGDIWLKKEQHEAFLNAVDKLMQGKAGEITSAETQATLTYWHERTHNLPTKSYLPVKYKSNQREFMEMATEFIAQKTLPEFYKMFNAPAPSKINLASGYANPVSNYQKAVSKLVKIGGLKEEDVLNKIKNHYISGKPDNQRAGFVEALYGAKVNNKLIDRSSLGKIVDAAVDYSDFQFTHKLNKILKLPG
jgi:hypothetical protein